MAMFASQLTRVTLDANRTITTGTIHILGIIVANGTAAAVSVVFKNTAGTEVLDIEVGANDSEQFNAHWVADAGLTVDSVSDAAVIVTVAHGADGA